MGTTLSELVAILNTETECYREMSALLDQEKRALSLSRDHAFARIQQKKEALVAALQHHEQIRRQWVDKLAQTRSQGDAITRVSELIVCVGPPDNAELEASSNRLRALIADVREKNRHNQQLINHYLQLVNGSLHLLTELITESSVYPGPQGGSINSGYRSSGGRLFYRNV